MIDAVMHRLTYNNPPTYKQHSSYRSYLQNISHYSCSYCTITESESPGATFNIDHFRPESLFPNLASTCINLRYVCPRCNSYKRQLWIPEMAGCIRDCNNCTSRICDKNVERFIDVLNEDPSTMLFLGDDNKLHAFSGSNPANYTIKYLRLNREQLIKLRYVRRFMDSWQSDLLAKKEKAEARLKEVEEEQQVFLDKNITPASEKERAYIDAIKIMHAMMELIANQSLSQIDEEIARLNKLIALRAGSDSIMCE